MATVYRALDTRLDCDVAVKVIRRDAFSKEVLGQVLKRFEREAKTLAKLTHPNIVNIIDYGEFEGSPYLVMPYIPSATLKERLGRPIPYPEAARMLAPIASALDYAHGKGVLHRDVKPSNILITESGEPVLTDFGIAKILENNAGQTLTGTGIGIGTPEYMSPEQGLGNPVDKRTDIYSLGVVFYEFITGIRPYSADTPMAVILKHITEPFPKPKDFVHDLPDDVDRMILRSMAKKPDDRFGNMAEFANKLESLSQRQSVPIKDQTTLVDANISPRTPDILEETQVNIKAEKTMPHPPNIFNITKIPQWLLWPGGVSLALVIIVLLINIVYSPLLSKYTNQLQTKTVIASSVVKGETTIVEPTIQVLAISKNQAAPSEPSKVSPKNTNTPFLITTPAHDFMTPVQTIDTRIREIDGMVQVYVPAGEFEMGSDDGSENEKPKHSVYLDAFWIDQTEITNDQYAQCVSDYACLRPFPISSRTRDQYYGNSEYSAFPVINVNWNQANAYCQWAGASLPSEAKWEKAARGVDGRIYPWGNSSPDPTRLNYQQNSLDTTIVGSFPAGASPYGALDMAGNVSEWVIDWYDADYYKSQTTWNNPEGPASGKSHGLRGGSWYVLEEYIRSSLRIGDCTSCLNEFSGFRCANSK